METYSPEVARTVPVFVGCIMFFVWFVCIVLAAILFCRIFSKAGYHWAMGLLMLIPVANLIMLCVLAFSQWPIQRELNAYRQARQTSPQGGLQNP